MEKRLWKSIRTVKWGSASRRWWDKREDPYRVVIATLSVNPPPPTNCSGPWLLLPPTRMTTRLAKWRKWRTGRNARNARTLSTGTITSYSCPMTSLLSCHFAFYLLIHFPLNALTRHCKRNLPQSSHAAALHQAPAYGQAAICRNKVWDMHRQAPRETAMVGRSTHHAHQSSRNAEK